MQSKTGLYYTVLPVPACMSGSGTTSCGFYVRSFCQGIDLVLKSYRDTLLTIESRVLADPHLSVATVQTQLEEVCRV